MTLPNQKLILEQLDRKLKPYTHAASIPVEDVIYNNIGDEAAMAAIAIGIAVNKAGKKRLQGHYIGSTGCDKFYGFQVLIF